MASSYFFFCKSLMPWVAIASGVPSGFLPWNQPLTVEQPKVKDRNTRGRSNLATRGAKVLLFISHQVFQLACRSLGGSCRPRGFLHLAAADDRVMVPRRHRRCSL